MESDKHVEIVLGNKNVAESGSTQVNITQNNFDPARVAELLEGLGVRDEGLGKSEPETWNMDPGTKPKRKRKARPARIVEDVYKYRWLNEREGMIRLVKLYQLLTDDCFKLLDKNVTPNDWCSLFMGEARSFQMKWIGPQAHLRYLFKLLIQKKYITFDSKSAKQWEILGSHFLNRHGKPFTDWDSQKDPVRGALTIERFAEVLNIYSDPPQTESFTDEINEEMKEFGEWEQFER